MIFWIISRRDFAQYKTERICVVVGHVNHMLELPTKQTNITIVQLALTKVRSENFAELLTVHASSHAPGICWSGCQCCWHHLQTTKLAPIHVESHSFLGADAFGSLLFAALRHTKHLCDLAHGCHM